MEWCDSRRGVPDGFPSAESFAKGYGGGVAHCFSAWCCEAGYQHRQTLHSMGPHSQVLSCFTLLPPQFPLSCSAAEPGLPPPVLPFSDHTGYR